MTAPEDAHCDSSRPAILVVDDEAMVLNILQLALSRRGFIVHSASSGREAIELYRLHHRTTRLALLDVCMPGMDGPATLAELRTINPPLDACFMSGHSGNYGLEDLAHQGILRFFDKPFRVHELAEELWDFAHADARNSA